MERVEKTHYWHISFYPSLPVSNFRTIYTNYKCITPLSHQAEIAAKLSAMPPRNKDPLDKPQPLILDDSGRTVDASGNQVQIASRMPTLKVSREREVPGSTPGPAVK